MKYIWHSEGQKDIQQKSCRTVKIAEKEKGTFLKMFDIKMRRIFLFLKFVQKYDGRICGIRHKITFLDKCAQILQYMKTFCS